MKKTRYCITCITIILMLTPLLSAIPQTVGQWAEQPQISNIKVHAYWEANGAKTIDILNSQRLAINLTQQSTVRSSADITIGGRFFGTETLSPGETKTIYYSVINPGTEQQRDNLEIAVTASEAYTGQVTSSDTANYNLLVNLAQETTSLKIHVQNSINTKPVVGLQVRILFPASTAEQELLQYPDANGDISLSLTTSSGGGYSGQLMVETAETADYNTSSLTRYVNFGSNDLTVNVVPKDMPSQNLSSTTFDWQLIIEGLAVSGFLVFLTVVGFVYIRKNRKSKVVTT